jgi:hypothetical protein
MLNVAIALKEFAVFLCVIFILSAAGCGNGDGDKNGSSSYPPWQVPYTPENCSVESQNSFVYRLMKDVYYWYDKVPGNIDPSSFSSPESLLNALKFHQLDRWSYITTKEVHDSWYYQGTYVGIGCGIAYDASGALRVAYVYPGSPADSAGIKRGDTILAINGKTVEEIEQNNLWSSVFGENKVGVKVLLKLMKTNGEVEELNLVKDIVTVSPVYLTKTFDVKGRKVGYLVFLTFIEPAISALESAFEFFKSEGVQELILDLRYNRGGLGVVILELASLIASAPETATFIVYHHNDMYSAYDYSSCFFDTHSSLRLSRLIVLTSHLTCSASESLINGLKPYIDVVTIGSTTCGKPVGMYPYEFCGKVVSPVTFEVRNALGAGGYFDGISPYCRVLDDLSTELGNTTEAMLNEAIHYIEYRNCSARALKTPVPLPPLHFQGFLEQTGAF